MRNILAIDAGTTGVTVVLVDDRAQVIAKGYQTFEQHFEHAGWVEHDPEQIWQATLSATRQVLEKTSERPEAIGITNQRETVALWDKDTLKAPTNAIVWQDRRTAGILDEPKFQQNATGIRKLTGLPLDPYFSASKLLWIKRNLPEVWQGVINETTRVGTIDSYLIARLTGGRLHITDATNASRTQLADITKAEWDDRLLDLFEIPKSALPKIVPSLGNHGTTFAPAFFDLELPILAIAGDQQAALFGQCAFEPGEAKCTYGTGAFLLQNTGDQISSNEKLIATIAWQTADGQITYAVEGSVFIAGAAVEWLKNIGIINDASELEAFARQVDSTDGVVFVPALAGLGAPYWNPEATGTLTGLTRGTTKAHIARATLEGIAWQVTDVFEAMSQTPITNIKVDGGVTKNDLLLEIQASQLAAKVSRPVNQEATALGVALMAGLTAGIFESLEQIKELQEIDKVFEPNAELKLDRAAWQRTIQKFN